MGPPVAGGTLDCGHVGCYGPVAVARIALLEPERKSLNQSEDTQSLCADPDASGAAD